MNQTIKTKINELLDQICPENWDGSGIIKDALVSVAELAYQEGGRISLESIQSAAKVANNLDVSSRFIRKTAELNNIGYKLPETDIWLFTESDVEILRQIPLGKPGRKLKNIPKQE